VEVNARDALQSVRFNSLSLVVATPGVSSSDWLLAQSFRLLQYRPYGLSDPTLPLAISSAVWSSCKRLRWLLLSLQSNPLSSFASV